jgi:hypothetical protein
MKNAFIKILVVLLLTLPSSIFAADFGLVIGGSGEYESDLSDNNALNYSVDVLPRFSTLLGENADLIISAGFSFGHEYNTFYIPELLRTEFSMRFGNSGIKVGRIYFSDPLSFIAKGLFDGIQYYSNSDKGNFYIGAWYTGLLYKERTKITMSEADQASVYSPLDYGNFSSTYFASKRVLSSVGWEHPSVGEFMHLNIAYIGQTDANGEDISYDSQYLIIKAGIPIKNFLIEVGGSIEFAQTSTEDERKFNTAFAGDFGLFFLIPSAINSRLSFTGTIAGGKTGDTIGAFNPITTSEYGYILAAKISGLSIFALNYQARFGNSLSASITASYFVRNDLGTFYGYPISVDNEEYFLGPEASARIIWSPASDLQFSVGGGAFFPSLGNTGSEEKVKWRFDLAIVLSIL